MRHLLEKAIVVTGAAQGLGEAYVRAIAAEGACVVVSDIDDRLSNAVVGKLLDGGARAVAHNGDVSNWEFSAGLIDRCITEFGRIDGLVNNAGVLVMKPIEQQDESSFRRQIEVNLLGQAFCGLHALRRMVPQGSGAVVNTFSGAQTGSSFRCAYSAASAGVAGLTYAWAAECAKSGVRVNAVAPIAATKEIEETETILRQLAAEGRISAQFSQLRQSMMGMTPEMNAPMVVYLLSDASTGVNGRALRLCGKNLNLLTRAVARAPSLVQDEWTVEKIDKAFKTTWKDTHIPFGLAEFEMNFVRMVN